MKLDVNGSVQVTLRAPGEVQSKSYIFQNLDASIKDDIYI